MKKQKLIVMVYHFTIYVSMYKPHSDVQTNLFI